MPETKVDTPHSLLEKALSDLIRQAMRVEIQEIVRSMRDEDRLVTIDQVAQTLAVSKDCVYRNSKKLTFTRKIGPKAVRFSENGLQKWLKEKGR